MTKKIAKKPRENKRKLKMMMKKLHTLALSNPKMNLIK